MSLYAVRRAGAGDMPAIYRIYTESLDDSFNFETVEWFMVQWPRGQLVAETFAGEAAGALSSYVREDGSASLALFAVDRRFRGTGAGSALMEAFLREAAFAGCPRVSLEVRVGNLDAIEFYERRGFVKTDLLKGIYGDGGDGYRMVRLGRA